MGPDEKGSPEKVLVPSPRQGPYGVAGSPESVPRCFNTHRNASSTASDVGNSAAKSEANRTRLFPSSKRWAYLPRTPSVKSYSGRISSRDNPFLCLLIISYLTACGYTSANDPNPSFYLGMDNDKPTMLDGFPDCDKPIFLR